MTTNQINYQKMLEDRRHNLSVERETHRQNRVIANLQEKQIDTNYSIAQEQLAHNRNVLSETNRHNLAIEAKDLMYATRMLDETSRHNIAQENISKQNLELTRQQINNNFAVGMANVAVANKQVELGYANVAVANKQVELGHANLVEQSRHNVASEAELNRHNVAIELNDAQKIQRDYELGLQRNAETQRNNVQQSLLHYNQNKETQRHNIVTEDVADRAQVTNTLTRLSEQANAWFKTFKRQ